MSDVLSSATQAFLRPGGSTGGCGGHSHQLLELRNEYQLPAPTPGPSSRARPQTPARDGSWGR